MSKFKDVVLFSAPINEAANDDNNTVNISGIANALSGSRNGVTITEDAVKNLAGVTVPLLMSHNWESIPVGKATYDNVTESGLPFTAELFSEFEGRQQVIEALQAGVLSVSVGFGVTEGHNGDDGYIIDGVDPLELSLTAVPADPKASAKLLSLDEPEEAPEETDEVDNDGLLEAIKKGFESINAKLDELLSAPDDSGDDSEPDTATEAIRLLSSIYATSGDALQWSMHKQLREFLKNKEN